jgi:AcrR family transcriptional regulator
MTLRDRQRDHGRELIRDAAEELFIANGYTTTPVTAIARRAGVAEKTVYNLFETKSGLLIDLFRRRVLGEGDEAVANQHEQVKTLNHPEEIIDEFCRINQQVAERALPLLRVLLEASAVDSDVARLVTAQEEHRYEDQAYLLAALDSRGHLRTDQPLEELQRSLWLAAAPELVIKAIDAGWSIEHHREWTKQVLTALLLPNPDTEV